ncbi:carbohydrate ABC transporter permease [Nocardioides anomalus]|uniref:carbohydrate ABC transporter permease n=1 Tax=Nocardioides anomalus TaxID=2712223 RepID=UPI001E5D10A9|nr:sugar ABC transporter permease [Nocardioides anomalus]
MSVAEPVSGTAPRASDELVRDGATPPRTTRSARLREAVAAWTFLSPNLLLLAVFLFLPLVWAVLLSFQRARSFGPSSWAGLANYERLLQDGVFWRSLLNTVIFTAATVPLSVLIGLGLALLMDKALPARGLFRTVVYLPIVVSTLVTSLVGLLLFDESIGVLNGMLADLGVGPVSWQTDGTLAMVSVVLMTLWTRVGFAMVVYLAALQDVPEDVVEAARVDGAGSWATVRQIVVPMLRSTTLFLVVVNVIWSFQIFDVVYVMTNGGPGYATSMLVTYAYEEGFGPPRNFGYGATVGVVLFLLTLVITLVQFRIQRRSGEES